MPSEDAEESHVKFGRVPVDSIYSLGLLLVEPRLRAEADLLRMCQRRPFREV